MTVPLRTRNILARRGFFFWFSLAQRTDLQNRSQSPTNAQNFREKRRKEAATRSPTPPEGFATTWGLVSKKPDSRSFWSALSTRRTPSPVPSAISLTVTGTRSPPAEWQKKPWFWRLILGISQETTFRTASICSGRRWRTLPEPTWSRSCEVTRISAFSAAFVMIFGNKKSTSRIFPSRCKNTWRPSQGLVSLVFRFCVFGSVGWFVILPETLPLRPASLRGFFFLENFWVVAKQNFHLSGLSVGQNLLKIWFPEPTARVTLEKISFSKYRANCYASVERLHVFRYVVLTRRNFSVTGGAKVYILSVKTYSALYFLPAYQSLTASYPEKGDYLRFSIAWNPYQTTFPQGKCTPVTVFFPLPALKKIFFCITENFFQRRTVIAETLDRIIDLVHHAHEKQWIWGKNHVAEICGRR